VTIPGAVERSDYVNAPAGKLSRLDAGCLRFSLSWFSPFPAIAKDFHTDIPAIAKTIAVTLARSGQWVRLIFGLMADRYGRRLPLMLDLVFYSMIEVLSGFAPNYACF